MTTILQPFGSANLQFSGKLIIDLRALQLNYQAIRKSVACSETGAVVKADAYGLGVGYVAPALYEAGCRHFFVALLAEAIELRQILGPDATIYVLNGLNKGEESECFLSNLVPVLNTFDQVQTWVAFGRRLSRKLPALLHVDTGMNRLGLSIAEFDRLVSENKAFQALDLLYLISHLAAADEVDSPLNDLQCHRMEAIASKLPNIPVSFANSGGVLLGKRFHYQLARPGIALYCGGWNTGAPDFLPPVVKLYVKVIQVREVSKGATVGYGGDYVTRSRSRLATIAAGYADGIPRCIDGHGAVYYKGARLPIRGRVSMDSTIVDISSLTPGSISSGSEVEVIGENQNLDDLARSAGTIANEILVRLGRRYLREYIR